MNPCHAALLLALLPAAGSHGRAARPRCAWSAGFPRQGLGFKGGNNAQPLQRLQQQQQSWGSFPQLRTPEPGSDKAQADGSVLLEAAPAPEREADVAGSQRLLLGSANKPAAAAAAARTAVNESSAPPTR